MLDAWLLLGDEGKPMLDAFLPLLRRASFTGVVGLSVHVAGSVVFGRRAGVEAPHPMLDSDDWPH